MRHISMISTYMGRSSRLGLAVDLINFQITILDEIKDIEQLADLYKMIISLKIECGENRERV